MPGFGIPCDDQPTAAVDEAAAATSELLCDVVTALQSTCTAGCTQSNADLQTVLSALNNTLNAGSAASTTDLSSVVGSLTSTVQGSTANYGLTLQQIQDSLGQAPAQLSQPVQVPSGPINPQLAALFELEAPPPPPPPEPVPPPPPPGSCLSLPPKLQGGLPVPGSEDFCSAAKILEGALQSWGLSLVQWVQGTSNDAVMLQSLQTAVASIPDFTIAGTKVSIGRLFLLPLVQQLSNALQDTLSIIKVGVTLAYCLHPKCNAEILLALSAAKSILRTLHTVKLAVSWPVNIGVDGSILLPKAEEYVDYLIAYYCPLEVPSVAEVMEAWRRDYISVDYRDCLLRLNGVDPATWHAMLESSGENVSADERIQYVRRTGGSKEDEYRAVRKAGVTDPANIGIVQMLYDELPSISDHLLWTRKNVFNDAYVARYQLMDGFAELWWPKFGPDLRAQGMREKDARLHYAAHWQMPAPGHLLEFVYRLRPGKEGVTNPFTLDDYQQILAEQDYNVLARKWYAETAYKVPALSYLRDMHRMGLLTDEQMQSYHADLGYTEDDSKLFVDVDTTRRDRTNATQGHGYNPAAIAKAYQGGTMPESEVIDRMTALRFPAKTAQDLMLRAKSDYQYTVQQRARSKLLTSTIAIVRDGLSVGTLASADAVSLLTAIGWTEQQANGIASLLQSQAATARVKRAVSRIRAAYLHGEVDRVYCLLQLSLLGIKVGGITDYLHTWDLEQTPGRKRRTAGQIVRDVADGQLDTATAKVMLDHLGYNDSDQRLYLADAQKMLLTGAAELQAAGQIASLDGTAAVAKALTNINGLSRQAVRRLQQQEPPAKLLKWVCQGVRSATYAVARLRLYGWDDASIQAWLASAEVKKERCLDDIAIEEALQSDVILPPEATNEAANTSEPTAAQGSSSSALGTATPAVGPATPVP